MRFTKIVLAVAIALTGGAGATVAAQRSGTTPSHGAAPAGVVRAAAETTKKTGSSRVSVEMTIGFMGQNMTALGEGAIDYLAQKGSLTLTMKGLEVPGGLNFEMVFADGVAYMRSPVLGSEKPWVKMDFSELTQEQGPGGLGMQNPADMLSFTEHAGGIRATGFDRVRGVTTTRYAMTINVAEAMADVDPELAEMFGGVDFDVMPAELWVDEKGLVRRFSLDMSGFMGAMAEEMGESTDGLNLSGIKMKMTMEFFDFGVPVEVTVPDPSEIGDVSELEDEETVQG